MIRLAAIAGLIACLTGCSSDANMDAPSEAVSETSSSFGAASTGTEMDAGESFAQPEWYSIRGYVGLDEGAATVGSVFEFSFYNAAGEPFCSIPMIVIDGSVVDAPDPGLYTWANVNLISIWPDETGGGASNSDPASMPSTVNDTEAAFRETGDTGHTGVEDTGDSLLGGGADAGVVEFPNERPFECSGINPPTNFSFGFGPYDTAFEPAVYGQGWDTTGLRGFYLQTSDNDPLWALGVGAPQDTFGLPAAADSEGAPDDTYRIEGLYLLPY